MFTKKNPVYGIAVSMLFRHQKIRFTVVVIHGCIMIKFRIFNSYKGGIL